MYDADASVHAIITAGTATQNFAVQVDPRSREILVTLPAFLRHVNCTPGVPTSGLPGTSCFH